MEVGCVGVAEIKPNLPVLLGPLSDPLLVGLLVMKRKDRRDVRPGVGVGSDGDAALDKRAREEVSEQTSCGRDIRRSMTSAIRNGPARWHS